jgi:tryptophan-rich sensory protein
MDNKMSNLLIIISITLIISFASMNKIDDWYLNLDKSALTPPGYMFSIVWITLYILMSISVWIVWNKEKKITLPIILYIIQIILNFAWSPIFFKYRLINESLLLLLLIWILVFTIINLFYLINKTAGLLLIPYLIWLSFAFYLNYYIVKNN